VTVEEPPFDLTKRDPLRDQDPVIAAVGDLAAAFSHHPGFMWTASGFEVLHADWPAYPIAHGLRAALYTLADYPASTQFFNADNIDACTLFSVNRKLKTNTRNPEHLWVAVWDEDLRELSRSQLIDGVSTDDEQFLSFSSDFIEVSALGRRLALVYELTAGVHPKIAGRVDEFLRLGRFDTAVRILDLGRAGAQVLRSGLEASVGIRTRQGTIRITGQWPIAVSAQCDSDTDESGVPEVLCVRPK
jgi:hypothetical protein